VLFLFVWVCFKHQLRLLIQYQQRLQVPMDSGMACVPGHDVDDTWMTHG
jgi:hypothetical protein